MQDCGHEKHSVISKVHSADFFSHLSSLWRLLIQMLAVFLLLLMGTLINIPPAAAQTGPITIQHVQKFAPELRFDRAAKGYPMSAQPYYEAVKRNQSGSPWQRIQNTDRTTLKNGGIPTYFQDRNMGGQARISYWWFYGYQEPCEVVTGQGAHNGDWEHVTVTLTQDQSAVAAVTYYQHGGQYTRTTGPHNAPCTSPGRCDDPRGAPLNGTHPIVYVGKLAHGSYHNASTSALGGVTGATCLYYEDYRNPASADDFYMASYPLYSLDGGAEPWMDADRNGGLRWGPDGPVTRPTQQGPKLEDRACDGNNPFKTNGCYMSECLAGDDQTPVGCLKTCAKGYTNMGLTCYKPPFKSYERAGRGYAYDYKIPTVDAGLSRLRGAESEWNLP